MTCLWKVFYAIDNLIRFVINQIDIALISKVVLVENINSCCCPEWKSQNKYQSFEKKDEMLVFRTHPMMHCGIRYLFYALSGHHQHHSAVDQATTSFL